MNNKKSLIIITIIGIVCILVGSLAYYRITVNGSIKGSTGNAVFNVTGFTNESTKEIVLKEGKLVPGDKGSFTLSLDATGSSVDMYVTLSIDRGTIPTNLKFYTTSDYKSELHKHYEFMDTSNQSKDITIYWYWNPYIDDEEDSNFINNTDLTATIKLNAVQISEYAMMKNGYSSIFSANGGTEFWNNTYKSYIITITFLNDLSNLPEVCNEENLCWDISYGSTQEKKVYAYLIDSGLDYVDSNSVSHDLYNLYIVSEAQIYAPIKCNSLFYNFTRLETINFNNNFNTSKVTSMGDTYDNAGMFANCRSLTSLDLSNFNTSKVTNMGQMFRYCFGLTSLDLSSFNTSKVTNMSYMFNYCKFLTSLDLSSFNTSKVTYMRDMFMFSQSLATLDLSSFNTSNVTDMQYMFARCSSLISLDLSSFNTSKVTDMRDMFSDCSSLTSLDVSSFNTSNVTNMSYMFMGCSSLTSLDLSSFNTSNVTNMYAMFHSCSSITTTINIMNAGVTSYDGMFYNAATADGALITVNYIADSSTLVDNMIAGNSNVVKGSQI